MSDTPPSTRELLNAQTGRLTWPELARHFARGVVICVDSAEDLLEVAESLVADALKTIERLHEAGRLHRADDEDAIRWQRDQPLFWAVVVAPWVLVQEAGRADDADLQRDQKMPGKSIRRSDG